jgi:hypothetical protein
MVVSDLVRREVAARFSAVDAPTVIEQLAATPLPFLDAANRTRERDRVHLAIVKLSEADMAKLPKILNYAARDWRDVLVWSGLGNVDWPDVLRAAGYTVPE